MPTLTPAEVAEELRLPSVESAVDAMRAGRIPAFKVGRYWRADADELAEWKRNGAPRSTDENRLPQRSARSQAQIGRRRSR